MKTLEYPMVVTQLDESTWNRILAPALTPALHKAGMSMNFPKAILFGPELFQGFQLMHPFFLQEISHITTHLQESVRGSQTGELLRLTAECFRLELGVPFQLGVTPYHPYSSYVSHCWYFHLWKFYSEYPIQAKENYPDLKLLRSGDQFLMEVFIAAGYRGKDLLLLNVMRMSIKAITVADIATADGLRLAHLSFLLVRSNGLRDEYDWPRAPPDEWSASQVQFWQRALRKALLTEYGGLDTRVLKHSAKLSH